MRKLISLLLALVLVLGLACARAEEDIPDLTGDWLIVWSREDGDVEMFLYLYEDDTYEILPADEGDGTGTLTGTWTFDGKTLVLTGSNGTLSLDFDGEKFQLTGEDDGAPVTVTLPVEPEDEGEAVPSSGRDEPPVSLLMGGWAAAEDTALTDDMLAMVDTALKGLLGVDYEPVLLLGTQVVAGTNYAFLCRAQVVAPDARPYWAVLYLYQDLEGNVSVMDIVPLELGL